MNREQLERLGEVGLRQMARKVGLRGARWLDRELLAIGLTAYFARLSPDQENDPADGPGESPGGEVGEIPPALTTETMARLLESQGESARASAVRARMAAGSTPPPTGARPTPHPLPHPLPHPPPPRVEVIQVTADSVELRWEGATDASSGLVLRLWTGPEDPVQWELPVSSPAGDMRFDPPPHTLRICAALGWLSPEGFVPKARSPILSLAPDGAGDGLP